MKTRALLCLLRTRKQKQTGGEVVLCPSEKNLKDQGLVVASSDTKTKTERRKAKHRRGGVLFLVRSSTATRTIRRKLKDHEIPCSVSGIAVAVRVPYRL